MTRSWVVIDHEALRHNLAVLFRAVGAGTELCAVVKADGYGHGALEVARTVLDAGAGALAVAHAHEGASLRAAGVQAPILLLSEPVDAAELRAVVVHRLQSAVYSEAGIDALAATGAELDVHLKVDTGMRRVGAEPADALTLAVRIARSPGLRLRGLWTHCAVADEPDNAFTAVQIERFAEVADRLRRAGFEVPVHHVGNSAALFAHPGSHHDMVRPGIALYGVAPAPALAAHAGVAELHPVLSWHAPVTMVKRVPAGEGVSYGHHRRTGRETVVATVPVGYADGLPRRWGLRDGVVLIGGRRCPILGVVTMDQVMVDCGPDAEVTRGDEAVLIGRQGSAEVTATEMATATDTIAYEILTRIGPRVERRHVNG